MTDHTKLKSAAEAVKQSYADLCEHGGDEFAEAWNTAELAYDDAANPDVVLALIAENDAALREATSLAMAIWRRRYAKDSPNFQTFEKASSVIGQIDNMAAGLMSDLEKLRSEVAGLKTGYEAYERVNAELKAENEALRKHAERYRWLRDSECAGRILRDMSAKVCRHTDQRIDAAMGKGEQS
ncbi:hypothetical protein VRC24_17050 [Pseudomonas poae]|uniref:hypothetical protein n=1 Tax=Pseudomonas poae TaxID=200451 RepID=UPI0030D37414